MREVTRVHIARIAYDIELTAKQDLEVYMNKLELYAGDPDILADIEIRIGELLAEGGVAEGGVVTAHDVESVRATLGEPEDFASDEEVITQEAGEPAQKKLYRNLEGSLAGGVLSGLATFFNIDVRWVRLAFIVLLFVSAGSVLAVYIVMWLVVPPARTAAEKLQLMGKPVTLASVREISMVNEVISRPNTAWLRTMFFVGGSIVSALVAIGALVATGVGLLSIIADDGMADSLVGSPEAWMAWSAFGLWVLSGLLLSALATIAAMALWNRRISKPAALVSVAIVVLGIVSFGTGVGLMFAHGQAVERYAQESIREYKAALPSEFSQVKHIVAQAYTISDGKRSSEMSISYVVSGGAPRYELRSSVDMTPGVVVDGDTARITLKITDVSLPRYGHIQPELTIYGPELEQVKVEQGNFQYSARDDRPHGPLQISALPITSATIYGPYESVSVMGGGDVDVSMASVRALSVKVEGGGSYVSAGVVQSLSVEQSDVCPAQQTEIDQRARVSVQGVSSGELVYNGVAGKVMRKTTACGELIIERLVEGVEYESE